MSRNHQRPPHSSICFCTKYTIDTMREHGQKPTLTELNQAIMSEAKYNLDWSAATILFQDFDELVWDRLSRLNKSGRRKKVDQCKEFRQSLKELWLQTPATLRPMSNTEIRYIRQVYQIMTRYAPSIKEANKYFLHMLRNHLDTPIYDDDCINLCLNSLIYLISISEFDEFLGKGIELVQIALDRGLGINKAGKLLKNASKGILSYHGLRISKDGRSLENIDSVTSDQQREDVRKSIGTNHQALSQSHCHGEENLFEGEKNTQSDDSLSQKSIIDRAGISLCFEEKECAGKKCIIKDSDEFVESPDESEGTIGESSFSQQSSNEEHIDL